MTSGDVKLRGIFWFKRSRWRARLCCLKLWYHWLLFYFLELFLQSGSKYQSLFFRLLLACVLTYIHPRHVLLQYAPEYFSMIHFSTAGKYTEPSPGIRSSLQAAARIAEKMPFCENPDVQKVHIQSCHPQSDKQPCIPGEDPFPA